MGEKSPNRKPKKGGEMAEGTMFRSNLSVAEVERLKQIAEKRGMSPRGLRDCVLREVIKKDDESLKKRRVVH